MKKSLLAFSIAAAVGAPVAGVPVVAAVAPAGASCPGDDRLWDETREVPLIFFGQNMGKTSVRARWQDVDCDGLLNAWDRIPSVTITNPALTLCGTLGDMNGTHIPPHDGWSDGRGFRVIFSFSLNGGPCSVWNDQSVARSASLRAHGIAP